MLVVAEVDYDEWRRVFALLFSEIIIIIIIIIYFLLDKIEQLPYTYETFGTPENVSNL